MVNNRILVWHFSLSARLVDCITSVKFAKERCFGKKDTQNHNKLDAGVFVFDFFQFLTKDFSITSGIFRSTDLIYNQYS